MKRTSLLLLLCCIPILSRAQFNSSQVYYYKYVDTQGGDVTYEKSSVTMRNDVYVVLFVGNYMQFETAKTLTLFRTELGGNPDYWNNRVRASYNTFYNRYSNAPTSDDFAFPCRDYMGALNYVGLAAEVHGNKYNPSASNNNLVTYTMGYTNAQTDGPSGYTSPKYWSEWHVGKVNLSFSADKNKLLIWDTHNSNNVLRYIRVELKDLKSDLNDLQRRFDY